jgi:hypothetical protein
MSQAADLLHSLRERGFALVLVDGRLSVSPGSLLTDADKLALKTHKADLIALLEAEPASGRDIRWPQDHPRWSDRLGRLRFPWED